MSELETELKEIKDYKKPFINFFSPQKVNESNFDLNRLKSFKYLSDFIKYMDDMYKKGNKRGTTLLRQKHNIYFHHYETDACSLSKKTLLKLIDILKLTPEESVELQRVNRNTKEKNKLNSLNIEDVKPPEQKQLNLNLDTINLSGINLNDFEVDQIILKRKSS